MIIEPNKPRYVLVYGAFDPRDSSSVEYTDKDGQTQTIDSGRVTGTFAEFFLPATLLTAESMPAEVKYIVDGVVVRIDNFEATQPSGTGEQGPQGPRGERGDDGASAFDIAVSNGFVGTETEWLDSLVAGGRGFGQELAYAEKTASHTSTNTTYGFVSGDALISGLSITVTGTGRPMDIEFVSPVRHSVANTLVAALLVVDGVTTGALASTTSISTTANVTLILRRRLIIPEGETRTIQVASYATAAGNTTWAATASAPAHLSATGR